MSDNAALSAQPHPDAGWAVEVMADLEQQIAATAWWRRRRIIWRTTRASVLGENGVLLPDDGTPYRWGFTRPQARRIHAQIREGFHEAYIRGQAPAVETDGEDDRG